MNPRHAIGDLIALSNRQRHAAKDLAYLVRQGHGNSPQAQQLAAQLFDSTHEPTVKLPQTETPRPKAGKKRKQRKGRAA